MKNIFLLAAFLFLAISSNGFSQEQARLINAETIALNSAIDPDDQQINKDEGYGPNDAEYNEAEGEDAKESQAKASEK